MKNCLIGLFLCLPFHLNAQLSELPRPDISNEILRAIDSIDQSLPIVNQVEIPADIEKIERNLDSIYNLIFIYASRGDIVGSRNAGISGLHYARTNFPRIDAHCANAWGKLAGAYYYFEDVGMALGAAFKAAKMQEELIGLEARDYLSSLRRIGVIYESLGDMARSIPFYEAAVRGFRKTLGESNLTYIGNLCELARVYHQAGKFEISEKTFLEGLKLEEKADGKSRSYGLHVLGLGNLYATLGQFEKAEKYLLIAQEVLDSNQIDKYDNSYVWPRIHRAELHFAALNYGEAKIILDKLCHLLSPRRDEQENLVYATVATLAGRLYTALESYQEAEKLLSDALEIREKRMVENHYLYAETLSAMAYLRTAEGNYDEAVSLNEKVVKIQKNLFGECNPNTLSGKFELGRLYILKGANETGSKLLENASQCLNDILFKGADFLTESELMVFWQNFSKYTDFYFSLPFTFETSHQGLAGSIYNDVLSHKGIAAETKKTILQSIASEGGSVLATYQALTDKNKQLAKHYFNNNGVEAEVSKLQVEADSLERVLVKHSATFAKTHRMAKWPNIAANLKSDEATIEFIHFTYHNPEPTDSTLYAAIVLRPGWKTPKLVYLCEHNELESLFVADDAITAAAKLYDHTSKRGVSPGGNTIAPQLYHLLWAPLDSLLKDVETIYYAPSGFLHRIAFDAILTGKKEEVLADRFKLYQLFSTRNLAINAIAPKTANLNTAMLFGGISYDDLNHVPLAAVNINDATNEMAFIDYSSRVLPPTRSHRGDGWSYLPGTKQEVDRLSKLLAKQGYGTSTFTDTVATEERFKQLGVGSPSPAILHIATHGFFFPDPALKKSQGMDFGGSTSIPLSEHPLMRSGLLLAGANKAWKEGKPFPGREDGILTAYEIAQVNLTGTKLAVLSACETGLGDIQGSEGVMGLQRSLKMAGVEKLIVSLWAVPDKESAVFMEMFYTKWLAEGKEIRDAFYETQRWMRKRYKNPLVWAGFVLVE